MLTYMSVYFSTSTDGNDVISFLPAHCHILFKLLHLLTSSHSCQDFYVWRNSSTAPTLWSGTKGAKVWHFDKDRKNWFYSRSGAKYPEFNYGSAEVKVMIWEYLTCSLEMFVLCSEGSLVVTRPTTNSAPHADQFASFYVV